MNGAGEATELGLSDLEALDSSKIRPQAQLPAWIARAADAGSRFSLTDLLIASLAADIGGLVWSLDSDFERMERLRLVERYDPPGRQ